MGSERGVTLELLSGWLGGLQTAKDIVDLARVSTLTTILDSIGDVHASAAARLIHEGNRRAGAARMTKLVLAVGQLEVAYEAYARRDAERERVRRVLQGVVRVFFGWIMGPDDEREHEFGRADEVAFLAATAYAALGDEATARERVGNARLMFDLYEQERRKNVSWFALADLVAATGAMTMIERHIDDDRRRFEAATRELSRLIAA